MVYCFPLADVLSMVPEQAEGGWEGMGEGGGQEGFCDMDKIHSASYSCKLPRDISETSNC